MSEAEQGIPDYDIKITAHTIKPCPGTRFPDGAKLIDSWTEVAGSETVTKQEVRRKDGSHYLRTIGADGFLRSWRELEGSE